MDFIGKPTRDEIVAFIKEQKAIISENEKPDDYSNLHEVSRRRAHDPTEEDKKWNEAHDNISKAVKHASKHLSEWHLGRIRSATGMGKMTWFFYLHPEAAESGAGLQELIATRICACYMYDAVAS